MSAPSDLAGFRCWSVPDARRVLDVDALEVPASVFRAVHHPVRFVRRTALPGEGTGVSRLGVGETYDEASFLEDLMDTEVDYRLVSVIGPSGAGKSHLIRWLHVHAVEAPETRRVLLIPRAGTNLRGVIRMILGGLEGETFERYRQRLDIAAESVSADVGRGRLLEGLAERIEHSDPDDLRKAHGPEREQFVRWVQEKAPAFLRDDVFRTQWLRTGGVIDRLYDLALGSASEVDRAESRRELTVDDFPLDVDPHRVSQASQASQQFYHQLNVEGGSSGASPLTDVLLGVLNSVRDEAVRSLVSAGTMDLGDLLTEVRRTLAEEGKELVLFIEDVARLQGIDRQLLDALLQRPNAEDPPLCPLRAVVGCTTAYYQEELPNTFRTRCSFVVDLDGDPTGISPVVPMALGYLNASRLGVDALDAWAAGDASDVPSACDACDLREACHATFGEDSGVGYYPFNRTVLRQTYARTNAEGLNPRFLVRDVLQRTLVDYADAIDQADFPNRPYHQAFGGTSSRWSASDVARVRQATGGGTREARTLALLDLWSASLDVPPDVYAAFGLDTAAVSGTTSGSGELPIERLDQTGTEVGAAEEDPETGVRRWLDALDAWARGGALDEHATNEMRGYLYDLVSAGLDWDAARLLPKTLASRSGGRPLMRPSFNFDGQARGVGRADVRLVLPEVIGWERSAVALALQGLIRYGVHGDWTFEGGGDALRRVTGLSERLCHEVEQQLRSPASVPFEPAAAAGEVLALGAQIHGLPMSTKTSPGDRLDAWYAAWGEAHGTPEWKRLAALFSNRQQQVQETLESMALCAKGGSAATRWFDTVQFASLLRRRDVTPREPLPADPEALPSWLRVIGQTRAQFDDRVDAALAAETTWWSEWSARIKGACGDEPFSDVRESVNKARGALTDAGVPHLRPSEDEEFQRLSHGLGSSDVDRARSLARQIADSDVDDRGVLLRTIGFANTLRREAERTARYLDLVEKGADIAEAALAERRGNLSDDAAQQIHAEIREALCVIESTLLPS